MSVKSNLVTVRFTDEELSKLTKLATKRDETIGAIVREMVKNCREEPVEVFKISSTIGVGLQYAQ